VKEFQTATEVCPRVRLFEYFPFCLFGLDQLINHIHVKLIYFSK